MLLFSVLHSVVLMRLGIYLQVPFCQTKCTYCNFHTGVFSTDLYAPYVESLCREIDEIACCANLGIAPVRDAVVDTVYFGGGTPSLLDPAGLGHALDVMHAGFECQFEEVTLGRPILKRLRLRKLPLGARLGLIASAWACSLFRITN